MGRTDWPPPEQILAGIHDKLEKILTVLEHLLKETRRHNEVIEK